MVAVRNSSAKEPHYCIRCWNRLIALVEEWSRNWTDEWSVSLFDYYLTELTRAAALAEPWWGTKCSICSHVQSHMGISHKDWNQNVEISSMHHSFYNYKTYVIYTAHTSTLRNQTHTHTYACMHVCSRVRAHTHIHICTRACTYSCVQIFCCIWIVVCLGELLMYTLSIFYIRYGHIANTYDVWCFFF